jgi:hypothetical protein
VHSHLVAVKVGVVSGADQRMQLNRIALNENRFEGLNAEMRSVPLVDVAIIVHTSGRRADRLAL